MSYGERLGVEMIAETYLSSCLHIDLYVWGGVGVHNLAYHYYCHAYLYVSFLRVFIILCFTTLVPSLTYTCCSPLSLSSSLDQRESRRSDSASSICSTASWCSRERCHSWGLGLEGVSETANQDKVLNVFSFLLLKSFLLFYLPFLYLSVLMLYDDWPWPSWQRKLRKEAPIKIQSSKVAVLKRWQGQLRTSAVILRAMYMYIHACIYLV